VQSAGTSPRLYLQLIDCKTGPTADDLTMIDYLRATGADYLIVATKCDKPNKTDRTAMLEALSDFGVPVLPFSALTGEGKDEIWAHLQSFLG
jgi:GTP-binding protein